MSIKEIQDEIVDEFSMFDDSTSEKLEYLVDLGKSLPALDEKYKTDDYLIRGCQSDLWLNAELLDGKVVFTASAAAMIPRGIIALLIRVFSNQTPKDILDDDTAKFIERAKLNNFFQMTRSNGLEKMIKQIKLYALAFNVKKK
ncbi:SufE family protein [Flavobacterium sp.]|jgi:cysteine desulfuration protein SufE|uniref:SufE family protein n=1 Tax=Flavobacterium sp. TaxID=239 RepID=UPI00378515F4